MSLAALQHTRWRGTSELWLDPLGDHAERSECELEVGADGLRYSWSYDGQRHTGQLVVLAERVDFSDTFHSPEPMPCEPAPAARAALDVAGTYAAGDGPRWGWRIFVALRPGGELVLQMVNIAPWGEEIRAVRMICTRA